MELYFVAPNFRQSEGFTRLADKFGLFYITFRFGNRAVAEPHGVVLMMDFTNVSKQHDQAVEGAKRLRTTIDALGKTQVPQPNEVNAERLYWRGPRKNFAEVVSSQERVGFIVYGNKNRPIFIGSAANDGEINKVAADFASVIKQKWGSEDDYNTRSRR